MSDGKIVIDTRLNTGGVISGLRRLKAEASSVGNSFSSTNNRLNSVSSNLNKVSKATGNMANKLKPLALGIGGLGTVAAKFSMDFETSMHKVYTIADKSVVPVDTMRKAILNLSNQTGISAISIANNVYDAISAGQKTGDAVDFVRKSTELATAGFATSGQTLDVLTSVYNAYGQTAKDVTKDSDILIATQNIGKTTVGQLSQNIGLLIPVAKESGVQLNQVGAGLALMTKQGIQTSEAITNYKAMLSELNKTGSKSDKILRKITGESFEELIKKGKSVGDIINILNQYASKNNMKLGDMFGNIRSVTGALSLAGHGGKDFNDILHEMDNSSGSTEKAFKEMSNTTQYNFKKSINQAKNALIGFGDVIAPFISLASQFISKIANAFNSMSMEQKKLTVGFGATIIGITGLLFTISKLTNAVIGLIKLGSNFKKAVSSVSTFAKAVRAGDNLTGKFLKGVIKLAKGFGNLVISIAKATGKLIAQGALWVAQKAKMIACSLATKAMAAAQWLLNAAMSANPITLIILAITALIAIFVVLWIKCDWLRNFWINLWKEIKSITKKVGTWLGNFFTQTIPKALNNLGKSISTFIKSIPKRLTELGKSFINWAQQMLFKFGYFLGYALGTLVKWGINVWNFFTKTIPQWISFVGQWFSKLPGEISKWLVDTYHKVVSWGKNMINKAITTGTEFINNLMNWFSQLPGRIWNWLVNTYNNTENWKNQMIQKAIEAASNFIDNFINWISQLPSRFSNWLSQALHSVAIWGINLILSGHDAAMNLVNSIVDGIKSLPCKMMNFGSYIVHGLWQGILNAKNNLINNIKNFCSSIVSGFKAGLGIHSPARELIPVGKYTIQGVSVGMDNEMPNLNDQVKDQMSKMVTKMKATVKAQTSAQNFKASFGSMHMNMNKSFKLIGYNEKQPVVINLEEHHVLDGEVIAAHTTHKVIENISENQNSYLIATGGVL